MDINDLQELVYENAARKGFYNGHVNIRSMINEIHNEVEEALVEFNKARLNTYLDHNSTPPGKPCGLPSELADIIIRTLSLSKHLGINIERELARKHNYNLIRNYKHAGEKGKIDKKEIG